MPETKNIERMPLFFGTQGRSLFGWYHSPKNNRQSVAMVICPPIGYEYVHTHRSLRHLADHLARSGIPCLRFDYDGAGDSAGADEDPDRVSAWLASIRLAISQARELSGCKRLGLIGFRMGATFAAMIAAEMDLACLVLWAPCLRGRNYSREMKALRMSGIHEQQNSEKTDTIIEGGGFVLTEQTIEDLSKIDLHKIIPRQTKTLVVMRDDLAEASQRLDQWGEHGVQLDYLKFSGYADIVAEPHYTKVPFETIGHITQWITSALAGESAIGANRTVTNTGSIRPICKSVSMAVSAPACEGGHINHEAADIRETIYPFGENNRLFGILSEPLNDNGEKRPAIILANAGSVHHIGPNRLYVLLARNISRAGFRCLRMDLPGLGDSFIDDIARENDSYVASSSADIEHAMQALQQEVSSFVVMGLCSGAHAAFHVALDVKSQPIVECLLINPLTFYWKEGMSLSTLPSVDNSWHYYKNTMRQKERWMKLIRGRADVKAILKTIGEKTIKMAKSRIYGLLSHIKLAGPESDNLNDDLKRISNTGRKISFIFSTTDPGYEILMSNAKTAVKKLSRKKMIDIQFIKDADHTFTTSEHRNELVNKVVQHLVRWYYF
ncbi:MAG: alpha/beta hydrolase [Gammaproteobacteria bacterium]|nr:alpha/beta hydrolase [Gammaproteobacteria bacterium]